jgi:hypothetical protein
MSAVAASLAMHDPRTVVVVGAPITFVDDERVTAVMSAATETANAHMATISAVETRPFCPVNTLP